MLEKGRMGLWIYYILFMAGSSCRSQSHDTYRNQVFLSTLSKCTHQAVSSPTVQPYSAIPHSRITHSNTFFASISLDYNGSISAITSNPDGHCLGWKVLALHLCTGSYRNQKPAAGCLQKPSETENTEIPTAPYLLSKKVSYASSMKIASSLFQIPSAFQAAVNNKACMVAHECYHKVLFLLSFRHSSTFNTTFTCLFCISYNQINCLGSPLIGCSYKALLKNLFLAMGCSDAITA